MGPRINNVFLESAKSLEEVLIKYRALCKSDSEFTSRMNRCRSSTWPSSVWQYSFDNEIIFYTEIVFEVSRIIFRIVPGEYKKRGVNGTMGA